MMNTVDQKEVAHFGKVENIDLWWADTCLLHSMNKVRVPFVLDAAKDCKLTQSDSLQSLKVLDVGCGGGILSEGLAKLGADVTGLDAGEEVIKLAKRHAQSNLDIDNDKIHYVCSTIEEFCKIYQNSFDLVIASEVIEHVNNPSFFLRCCIKTLKPNCPVIITTINRTWYSKWKAILFFEYLIRIIPRGTHDWKKFITPEELQDMFTSDGCKQKTVAGVDYNWRQKKWELTTYSSNFYMTYAVKN